MGCTQEAAFLLGLRCLEGWRRRKGIAGGSEGGREPPTVRSGSEPTRGTLLLLSFQDSARQGHHTPTLQRTKLRPREDWALAHGPRMQEPGFQLGKIRLWGPSTHVARGRFRAGLVPEGPG